MKEEAFAQLVESIQQAGEIRRGQRRPPQVFEISPLDVKALRIKLQTFARIGVKMNALRIKAVTPQGGRHLLVTFVNGIQKIYDCQEIMNLERFRLLNYEAFFKAVRVDPGGYGVSWNDDMDLSEYELWHNGLEVEQSAAWSKEGMVVQ